MEQDDPVDRRRHGLKDGPERVAHLAQELAGGHGSANCHEWLPIAGHLGAQPGLLGQELR